MDLRGLSSHEEIARQVVAQLQTQHVVLVFHDLDSIGEDYLDKLSRNFWLPLATLAQQSISLAHEFYLLMFLLDQEGCVGSWKLSFAEQLDDIWQPYTPLKMPAIELLSDQVLMNWIKTSIDALPSQVTKKIDNTVRKIIEESGGVPEKVFAQIFELCGCRWQEEEERWLKL